MSVRRRKMIIDCDTGVDDSLAILIALEAESLVDVIAITCVNGNCTVDNAVRNSLITTKMAGKNVSSRAHIYLLAIWSVGTCFLYSSIISYCFT